MIGCWHHNVVCLSVCLSVTLCIVAKRYRLHHIHGYSIDNAAIDAYVVIRTIGFLSNSWASCIAYSFV